MTKSKIHLGKIIYLAAILALVIGFVFFIMEKSKIVDLYTKPVALNTSISSVYDRPVNDVDYSPSKPEDNTEINEKKESGEILNSGTITVDLNSPISITLTAANQDVVGGPIVVRTVLENVAGGTCVITISKGDISMLYNQDIISNGRYYSCAPLDIPYSSLKAGTWNLNINVKSSDDRSDYIERQVEVSGD